MTRRTITLVDTYCRAANWQHSIDCNNKALVHVGDSNPQLKFQIDDEIRRYSIKRDRIVNRLRTHMEKLTEAEKDWVAKKCGGDDLAAKFRALGIEPNWPAEPARP